jgi:predicted metal-dependent phosphoesterase TrpH
MLAAFPTGTELVPRYVEGALDALDAGDASTHDRLVAEAARDLGDCDVIALAQFSLTRAAKAVEKEAGKTVLTAPASAVRKLRALLDREARGREQ